MLFFPLLSNRFWGGNVILSVGYAHGSSSTQPGLNVNVSRDILKNVFFCLSHFIFCLLPSSWVSRILSPLLISPSLLFSSLFLPSPGYSFLTPLLYLCLFHLLIPPMLSTLYLSPDSIPYCSVCFLSFIIPVFPLFPFFLFSPSILHPLTF